MTLHSFDPSAAATTLICICILFLDICEAVGNTRELTGDPFMSTVSTQHHHQHQHVIRDRSLVDAPIRGNGLVVRVYNDQQLLAAFYNSAVITILLSTPTTVLNSSSLFAYANQSGIHIPVPILRNLTVSGDPNLSRWPTLDLRFIKSLIKLENNVWLYLSRFSLLGARSDNPSRILGLDFIELPEPGETSYLVANTMLVAAAVCYDANTIMREISLIKLPEGAPKIDVTYPVSQEGCTNDTSQVPQQRCWPLRGYLRTLVAVSKAADNSTSNQQAPNNLILLATNVSVACQSVVTPECVLKYGSPYFCLLDMYRTVIAGGSEYAHWLPVVPQQQEAQKENAGAPATQADVDHNNMALVIGLAVGLGGSALIAATVVAVVVMRRRRHRHRATVDSGKAGSGEGGWEATLSSLPTTAVDLHDSTPASSLPPPEAIAVTALSERQTKAPFRTPKPRPSSGCGASSLRYSRSRTSSIQPGVDEPVTFKMPTRADLVLDIQMEESPGAGLNDSDSHIAEGNASCGGTMSCTADSDVEQPNMVSLVPGRVLGKGSFGRVVEGTYGGQKVAVKLLAEGHVGVDGVSQSLASSFQYELQVLGRCQHPNIVRLLAACVTPPRLCLVLELMDTSLSGVMYSGPEKRAAMSMDKVLYIGMEISRALAYLHPTIVHRDLKPGNVLVNDPWSDRPVIKLTDFGLSRLRDTVMPTKHPDAGTPAYMAPECFDITNKCISHKADIYSLGVLLWEMLSGSQPWTGLDDVAIAVVVTYKGMRPSLDVIPPERLPAKLAKLLLECWERDPARRPAADEVLKELAIVNEQMLYGTAGGGAPGSSRLASCAGSDSSALRPVL